MRLLSFLFSFSVLFSCSNKDESLAEVDQETSPLTIISYSPTTAYTGDEVTIIAEGIDILETYSISFNNVLADSITVKESEFKVTIPEDATSGDITIDFLDFQNEVGPIQVTQELDKFYILGTTLEYPTTCEEIEIYDLDFINMELTGLGSYVNYSCTYMGGLVSRDGMTLFSKQSNTATFFYEEYTSQGQPSDFTAKVLNLNTFEISQFDLNGDNWYRSLSAVNDTSLYFTQYYNYDFPIGETYRLYAKDLITSEEQVVYDFPIENKYSLRISGIIPSSNTLFSFTEDNNGAPLFLKINLDTNELTTVPLPDAAEYSNILVNEDERVFVSRKDPVTRNRGQIMEINPQNGLPINVIATLEEKFWVKELQYSTSTGRIFGLIYFSDFKVPTENYLFTLELTTNNLSKTILPETPRFYYIYLNQ